MRLQKLVARLTLASLRGVGKAVSPVQVPGLMMGVAGKSVEVSGKSWRANREIKEYAGGGEHFVAADESVHTAGMVPADAE